METYTIQQKMSNTGSIADLASDTMDREIQFRGQTVYAVIIPAYYGGKGYTTHVTAEAAAKEACKLNRQGYRNVTVIDKDGDVYDYLRGYYDYELQ